MYPENTTAIKMQIDISAQKMIQQVLLNNEEFEKQLLKGIEEAVKKFDFQSTVENMVERELRSIFSETAIWNNLRKAAREKADKIVDDYIQKKFDDFKKDINR